MGMIFTFPGNYGIGEGNTINKSISISSLLLNAFVRVQPEIVTRNNDHSLILSTHSTVRLLKQLRTVSIEVHYR
jgi:hypothetical protein